MPTCPYAEVDVGDEIGYWLAYRNDNYNEYIQVSLLFTYIQVGIRVSLYTYVQVGTGVPRV